MEQVSNRGFKRKTIRDNIRNKLADWAKSIKSDDKELEKEIKKIIKNSVIVTGGSIASMLQGQLPNDYDCYFQNKDDAKKVAGFYIDKYLKKVTINDRVSKLEIQETNAGIRIYIKSAGVAGDAVDLESYAYFEGLGQDAVNEYLKSFKVKDEQKKKYSLMFFTDNAMTLANGIQLIFRFTGDVDQIHENFDFVHCRNSYKNGQVFLDPDAMEAILAKELRYVGSLFPVCSIFRLRKFIKRGWSITAGEIFKICFDISKLDLSNTEVLQDQLMGMDYAYFREVIEILKKNSSRELDRTYLFELVDRVFDGSNLEDEYEGDS